MSLLPHRRNKLKDKIEELKTADDKVDKAEENKPRVKASKKDE